MVVTPASVNAALDNDIAVDFHDELNKLNLLHLKNNVFYYD